MEIASGTHPYSKWKTPFEQLKQVVHEPAPRLSPSLGFSDSFQDFVAQWYVVYYKLDFSIFSCEIIKEFFFSIDVIQACFFFQFDKRLQQQAEVSRSVGS